MQKILVLLSFLFIFGFQTQLKAQKEDFSKSFSLQSTIGFGRSLHYFAPVQMRLCFEGCPVEKQEGRFVHHVEMAIYRQFKPNQEYSFGFGNSRYRFFEEGLTSPGNGLFPYERIVKRSWIQLHLGHRYTFLQKEKSNLFIENGIITDWKVGRKSSYLNVVGFSFRLKVGLQYEPIQGMKLLFNGYYKTAIAKYNKETIGDKNYYPYNYGIEISALVKIIKKKK